MSSLRLALKMSMAGAPKPATTGKNDFDAMPDPPVVRKRKSSFEGKPKSKRSKDAKSSNSSVDTHEDDYGEKSTRSNSPVGEASMDDNTVNNDDMNIQDDQENGEEVPQSSELPEDNLAAAIDSEEEEPQLRDSIDHSAIEESNLDETKENHESESTEAKNFAGEEEVTEEKSPDVDSHNEIHEGKSDENTTADTVYREQESNYREEATDYHGDQEMQNEEKDRKQKKKRRGSSMLRGLGLEPNDNETTNNTESNNNPEHEEENRRYQSSRTAAAAAKSKLSKSAGGKSEVEVAASTTSATNSKAKKGGSKSNNQGASSTAVITATTIAAPALEWVQCDGCSKWRSVAAHINLDDLPEQWFCHMNTWSTIYNNCEVAEEVVAEDDTANAEAKVNDEPVKQEEIEKSATKVNKPKSQKAKKETIPTTATATDGGDPILEEKKEPVSNNANRRRVTNKSGGAATKTQSTNPDNSAAASSTTSGVDSTVNWVACNKCNKWRKVPGHIKVEELPEEWYCSLNTWNILVARCSAKQEEDDTVADQSSVPASSTTQAVPQSAAKEKSGGKGKKGQGQNVSFASPNLAANNIAPVVHKTNWVRCEQKNCKKWRKVPAHIDVDKLPEKWFCSMNTWNPDTASCDAPEESDSEAEGGSGGANAIASLISLNSKSATALSYRRIIFGNDGKVRVCFTDKNKNGFGIFSYVHPQNKVYYGAYDEANEPKRRVSYWWSSAYDESVMMAKLNAKSNKKTASSLFNENDGDTSGDQDSNRVCYLNTAMKYDAQPTYLLDSIRRLYGMTPSVNSMSIPKLLSKSWKLLVNMPLTKRQKGECTVIRSLFLTSQYPNVLLSKLQQLIGTCRFQNPEIDACREFMTNDGLKMALRRMEMNGEVEVSFTKDGQLLVLLLMPMTVLKATLASKSRRFGKVVNKTNADEKWTKEGYPLKMRKFFVNGSTSLTELPTPPSSTPEAKKRKSKKKSAQQEEEEDENEEITNANEEAGNHGNTTEEITEPEKEEEHDLPDVDEVISPPPADEYEENEQEDGAGADQEEEEEEVIDAETDDEEQQEFSQDNEELMEEGEEQDQEDKGHIENIEDEGKDESVDEREGQDSMEVDE